MTRREFHPPHGPRGCVAAHCSAAGGSRAEAATSLRRELRSRHIADKPLRRFHRKALSDAETLGASKPNGNVVPRHFEYAADRARPVRSGAGEKTARRGWVSERV